MSEISTGLSQPLFKNQAVPTTVFHAVFWLKLTMVYAATLSAANSAFPHTGSLYMWKIARATSWRTSCVIGPTELDDLADARRVGVDLGDIFVAENDRCPASIENLWYTALVGFDDEFF